MGGAGLKRDPPRGIGFHHRNRCVSESERRTILGSRRLGTGPGEMPNRERVQNQTVCDHRQITLQR